MLFLLLYYLLSFCDLKCMYMLVCLMMFHRCLRLFSHSFFFLLLRLNNLNWPNFKFPESFFCLLKSVVETCSEFSFVFVLFNSRISIWLLFFNNLLIYFCLSYWYSLCVETSFSPFPTVLNLWFLLAIWAYLR